MSKASDRAYETIKAAILDGRLYAGAPLREEELAVLCGVSRTPVRDAMHRLEAQMFIQRSDSQRSFVATWSAGDIDELFTLRTMLEAHAAAEAARRITAEQLLALHRNVEAIDTVIERPLPDVDRFLEKNSEFHALIVAGAASERLAAMVNRLVLQPVVQRTARRYDGDQLRRSLAEHVEIVAALEARDSEWARAVMTSHIRRAFHVYQAIPPDA